MKKKQIDSKLALLEIETLVSNYTETEVDIFIGILCVRFMREYNISKEELLESLSGNIDRLTFVRKYFLKEKENYIKFSFNLDKFIFHFYL